MTILNYNNILLNKIFKREMKTTKTSVGIGGGDDDPNKDKWTDGYKSSHANDSKQSAIEIKYQKLLESNQKIREGADQASTALSEILQSLGVNISRLNTLAIQNQEKIKNIEDNTNNLNSFRNNMDNSINEMSEKVWKIYWTIRKK